MAEQYINGGASIYFIDECVIMDYSSIDHRNSHHVSAACDLCLSNDLKMIQAVLFKNIGLIRFGVWLCAPVRMVLIRFFESIRINDQHASKNDQEF